MKIEIDLDLGQVVGQAVERIEELEKALTLTTTSREFNRKRVVELEDELDRYRRAHVCTSRCQENAHVAFEGSQLVRELEAELATERERADKTEDALIKARAKVEFKTRVADDMDKDKDTLFRKLEAERALVQEERTRANNLARRVAELERSLAISIDRENKLEADAAEEARLHAQSIAARDRLLAAATTRVKTAVEILSRPMVVGARNEIVTSKGAVLADAIGNALAALDA